MPDIVQEIGSYAGLASVAGLAVLAALYFSQARDVKRLREWAGRAPERAEQSVPAPVPGRVPAQPQGAPAQARPGAPPVPGQAAAAGARPATSAGQAAPAAAPANPAQPAKPGQPAAPARPGLTPAGANSKGATDAPAKPGVPVPAGQNAGAPAAPARPGTPQAAPQAPQAAPARAGATPAGQRPGGSAPLPAGAAGGPGRPGGPTRPTPQETAIIPPPGAEPWYRRLIANPLYVVLAVAGVLIVGGAAAFGITQLASDDPGSRASGDRPAVPAADDNGDGADGNQPNKQSRDGAVKPGNVTVAVLNGTTVPGLAATLSDEVGKAGFTVGTIANFTDQQLAESVVQFAPGHEREAAAVARKVGIGQREAVNPSSQELAGDATVIVLVGSDKAP